MFSEAKMTKRTKKAKSQAVFALFAIFAFFALTLLFNANLDLKRCVSALLTTGR
jgi:hypothetical protein